MKHLGRLLIATVVLLIPLAEGKPAEMKTVFRINKDTKPTLLQVKFGVYDPKPTLPYQSLYLDEGGYRLFFQEGTPHVGQSGLYSLFALAGNCEVTLIYELYNLQPPKSGPGSGVGLCFETEKNRIEGTLMRLITPDQGSGYLCRVDFTKSKEKGKGKDDKFFKESEAKSGKMGLRRLKKELIFLTADSLDEELQEIKRLPFTDETIRPMRFFYDPGGSPTAIDARLIEIDIKSEELTGGASQLVRPEPTRWPWLFVPVAGLVLFWLWRRRRRQKQVEDLEERADKPTGRANQSQSIKPG